ncbi:MAG: uroporphyrinogen decarboxylase family protein [Christensenella sp.]|nr:uroporphyrinogen decarboxylase family protein [Christensenella sp.]
MNARQLLLDTLAGKPTERVPVAPFIYQNLANEYHGGFSSDPIADTVALYRRFGFDILLRSYIMTDYLDESFVSCDTWRVEKTRTEVSQGWNEICTVTTPERVLRQIKSFRRVSQNEMVEATTEYFIKEEEDFRQFERFQPPLPRFDCSKIGYARSLVGEDGLVGTWIHGAFNMVGLHRKLDDLLMDPYTDEDLYRDMIEYFGARVASLVPQLMEAGCDFLSVSGNMASGSMAGPKMFEQFVMPYEMRLIEAIHRAGGKMIYHNCGDARFLLPLYGKMGIDLYESLTAAPFGDTVLEDALLQIPLPTVLSGGIDQIQFLKTATPSEVSARVRDVLSLVKQRGGFILAASDYFSEGTPPENLQAFANAAREFGKY